MKTLYIKPDTRINIAQIQNEVLLIISGGGIGSDDDYADSNENQFDEDETLTYSTRGLWDDSDLTE